MGSRGFIATILVAMLTAGALAASASAEPPQWYECAKQTGGAFEKGCKKEGGTGGWVLKPGIGKGGTFKGSGATMIWHMVVPGKGDFRTECASWKATGGVAAPNKVVGVVLALKKCKVFGAPCKTEGGTVETITSEKLAGELGWFSKAGGSVGLALYNEAAPKSGFIAHFECEAFAKERWLGAVVAAESPFGVMTNEYTSTYSVGPYLGELEPGYTPLTNPPAFEEGTPGALETELNGPETGNSWQPEGGLPSGWESSLLSKGETLAID